MCATLAPLLSCAEWKATSLAIVQLSADVSLQRAEGEGADFGC